MASSIVSEEISFSLTSHENLKIDDIDVDPIWEDLRIGIAHIYERNEMPRTRYMELYTHVYNYCTRMTYQESLLKSLSKSPGGPCISTIIGKNGGFLAGKEIYKSIMFFLKNYLDNIIKQWQMTLEKIYLKKLIQKDSIEGENLMDEALLEFYKRQWEDYLFSSKVLNAICSYLNRHWVRKAREKNETNKCIFKVFKCALVLWKIVLFKQLHIPVLTAILKVIAKERNGEIISSDIKTIIQSYVDLGFQEDEKGVSEVGSGPYLTTYQTFFEARFLVSTVNFYVTESVQFLQQNPFTEYMKKVEQWLNEEQKRVELYLHPTTMSKVIKRLEIVLIKRQLDNFYSEFKNLLHSDKEEDLGRMYTLVARLDEALGEMRENLEAHITAQGLLAVEQLGDNINDPKQYISAILDVHKKYNNLVKTAFKSDFRFVASLDKASQKFINDNKATCGDSSNSRKKSPELLAKYCDLLLKKSKKNIVDHDIEETLNQVMVVFKYLEDKDVFQNFYSKLLANRLINNSSASDEAELSMIGKLKHSCGLDYTIKLQQMYQDLELWKNLNDSFKEYLLVQNKNLSVDLNIKVVRNRSWPFTQSPEFTLPTELEQSVSLFTEFYNTKHNGRKLSWLHNLSKGDVHSSCFPNRHIFQASTFQLALILMFNIADSYTVKEMIETTKLSFEIIIQVLQSLIKAKLFRPENHSDELGPHSVISLNKDYKNKKCKVNVNAKLKLETKEEDERTFARVEDDRKHSIEASIVRILKMRKVIQHQELLAQVLAQLSTQFTPTIPMIKKCIDRLIDKEYLERIDGQKDTYSYLA